MKFQLAQADYNEFLLDLLKVYNYEEIGISIDLVNKHITPKWGVEMIDWIDGWFEVTNQEQSLLFLLNYGGGVVHD